MRKISKEYENPIDNIIIDIVDDTSDFYKKLGFTPNGLTTLSLLLGLLSSYLFYKNHNYIASILFFLAYFYDCADGHFARKYKMTSKFGDIYDHISDVIKMLVLLYVMYLKSKEKFFKLLPLIIILAILASTHLGCQENIYDKDESQSLYGLKQLCNKDNAKQNIHVTKYFGFGTFNLIIAIIIATY